MAIAFDLAKYDADKFKPLKLSGEQAKKLRADLGDAKDEAAKAAFEKLRYFDPRLALEVGDMLKDLPQGQHRQRVAALLIWFDDLNCSSRELKHPREKRTSRTDFFRL